MARILLIDDEDLVLFTLRTALEAAGHSVVEAGNGVEGIALRQSQPFDLIVTDIIMPEMDGVQAIKELRQLYPQQKIMAIAGGGRVRREGRLEFARKVGAERVLAKPFFDEEFLASVEQCLAG
jgi:CheY-like chemotaxis protein